MIFIINNQMLAYALSIVLLTVLSTATIDYDMDVSRRMRTYSIIGHCTRDQIVNWHCQLCTQT